MFCKWRRDWDSERWHEVGIIFIYHLPGTMLSTLPSLSHWIFSRIPWVQLFTPFLLVMSLKSLYSVIVPPCFWWHWLRENKSFYRLSPNTTWIQLMALLRITSLSLSLHISYMLACSSESLIKSRFNCLKQAKYTCTFSYIWSGGTQCLVVLGLLLIRFHNVKAMQKCWLSKISVPLLSGTLP